MRFCSLRFFSFFGPAFLCWLIFLCCQVEKPLPEPQLRPSLPPLFASSGLADGTSIDDELVFRSDQDYQAQLLAPSSPARAEAASGAVAPPSSSVVARLCALGALSLVVPASAVWIAFQSQFMREWPSATASAPYL